MKFASAIWGRLPVILRAILTGLLVLLFGALIWSTMVGINLKLTSSVPWAAGTFAIFLWAYWRYLDGAGWPRNTAEARHRNFRVRALPGRVWTWALIAGAPALVSAVALQGVFGRLIRISPFSLGDLSRYPFFTVLCILIAAAAEAGMVEEAAFRGYMQAPIERRYGPKVAIVVVAVLFGCIHLANGSHELFWLPLYSLVGVIFGSLAYLTNSILPGMVLHAAVDTFRFLATWRLGPPPRLRLVWQSGPDASFWTSLAVAVILGVVAIWAFRKLAVVTYPESHAPQGTAGPKDLHSAGEM
jgi:membrane protease YdiL (CAAX protease family)